MKSALVLGIASVLSVRAATVTTLRTPDNGIQPQAGIDANGTVHLIYFKGEAKGGDIFYVRREASQTGFSKPIRVNTQPHTAMAIGSIRGAQLAVGKNGRVHVVWDGMGEGATKLHQSPTTSHNSDSPAPLFYTRLNDTGHAFEPERNVISYAYGLDGGSSIAADQDGNVYVTWHAPQPGNTDGEAGRAVFIARSTDEGKTFQREQRAISKPTGACGCCGMRAFANSHGDVLALYRAAYQKTNRDETLLISHDQGASFDIAYSHHWSVSTCPMSSATLSESSGQVLAAAETHGRVFFIQLDLETGKVSSPISPETQAKHPVVVGNTRGEILLAWAEGTGWNKSGAVVWQLHDREGKHLSGKGRTDGLPVWSLPTGFTDQSGNFTIVY